jgi:hypothetical protein
MPTTYPWGSQGDGPMEAGSSLTPSPLAGSHLFLHQRFGACRDALTQPRHSRRRLPARSMTQCVLRSAATGYVLREGVVTLPRPSKNGGSGQFQKSSVESVATLDQGGSR